MTHPAPISAPFAGRADLLAMESIVSAAWRSPSQPLVPCTVGDLEWWLAGGGPDVDWSSRIRIWSLGGEPVGWGWFKPPASLDWFVAPSLTPADAGAVRDGILDWHRARARAEPPAAGGADEPAAMPDGEGANRAAPVLDAWAADGWPEATHLAGRGWTRSDVALTQFAQALDFDLDPPRVPDGYVLRSLRGPEDIPARVEVHRAAFAPSRLTVEKYGALVGLDHYAFERDIVLEAADGTFAAFAMCWADQVGSIGEFEPVGTHPDHQRRGLGRAIMRHGLRLMRDAGLSDAIVFSHRANTASEALYRSAGFHEVAIHRLWTAPIGG